MTENEKHRLEIEQFFQEEYEPGRREVFSPSGRYKLLIRSYHTKPGAWNYSRGTVYRVEDDLEICDIKRNYSTFHHSFVVKDGQEWLISGRSYMSQTIVNLDTAESFEPSGNHYDGQAFCWAQGYLSPDGNTLAVLGCYWACPYEIKFFDFSHPASGWSELPIEPDSENVDSDLDPVWKDERTFEARCGARKFIPLQKYESDLTQEEMESIGSAYQEAANWETVVDVRMTLQRQGDKMVIVSQWISEQEQQHREQTAQAERAFAAWRETYCAEDEIYLTMTRLVETYALADDGLIGIHPQTHQVVKYFRQREPKASADLQWQAENGPISVRLYDGRGMKSQDVEFPFSVVGMREAMECIRAQFSTISHE